MILQWVTDVQSLNPSAQNRFFETKPGSVRNSLGLNKYKLELLEETHHILTMESLLCINYRFMILLFERHVLIYVSEQQQFGLFMICT